MSAQIFASSNNASAWATMPTLTWCPMQMIQAAELPFFTIGMPIMEPALATKFVFQFVSIWRTFFFPLVVLSRPDLFPVTLGVSTWQSQTQQNRAIVSVVITGSLIAFKADATTSAVKG